MTVSAWQGVCHLPYLGVIRVTGADAASFLQGQLTNDFALLPLSEARLAAWCNAKGRMLASFVGFKRSHEEIWLVCSRDLLLPTLKRLSMFVLRAKAQLSDASDEIAVWGRVSPATPGKTWSKTEEGDASVVRLPEGAGHVRELWCAPAAAPGPVGPALPEGLWAWLSVHGGVAMIGAPVVEAFVPQMLNYESVGGVNFKKGCYPGQEVVARSQFRGTLKRRAYIVHANGPLAAGQEVFHASDAEQPCGQVVQAAPAPTGGFDAIVSMTTASADGQALRVGDTSLGLLPLPYPLLDDI